VRRTLTPERACLRPDTLLRHRRAFLAAAARRCPPSATMARRRAALVALAAGVLAALAAAAAAIKVETKRASAEILWDDYGVPHIYADNHEVLVRRRADPAMSVAHGLALMRALSSFLLLVVRAPLRRRSPTATPRGATTAPRSCV